MKNLLLIIFAQVKKCLHFFSSYFILWIKFFNRLTFKGGEIKNAQKSDLELILKTKSHFRDMGELK